MSGAGAPLDLLVVDAVAGRHGAYRDLLGGLAREVVTVPPGEGARLLRERSFAAVLVRLNGAADEAALADLADGALSMPAPSGPPVIVISAQMPELRASGPSLAGAFEYVPEPFAAELLRARVSCALELARLRVEVVRLNERVGELVGQVDRMGSAVAEERRTSDALRERVGEQIHRSKNLLAIMQSVAHRTIGDGRAVSEAREVLMGRFRALARAHQLITAAEGRGIAIADAVEPELADVAHRVTASGPPVRLAGSVVQTFVLAIHELAHNATRHGALRSPNGAVALGWTFFDCGADRYLEVAWTERGGAPPKAPSQYGFGLTLVSSFAGVRAPTPCISFDASGLTCRMRLSQDAIVGD